MVDYTDVLTKGKVENRTYFVGYALLSGMTIIGKSGDYQKKYYWTDNRQLQRMDNTNSSAPSPQHAYFHSIKPIKRLIDTKRLIWSPYCIHC